MSGDFPDLLHIAFCSFAFAWIQIHEIGRPVVYLLIFGTLFVVVVVAYTSQPLRPREQRKKRRA